MARRGELLVYTLVAGFLWFLVVLDHPDRPVPRDRHLIPELRNGEVAALTFERGHELRLGLRRQADGALAFDPADRGRVDPVAARDLIENLQLLRCARKRSASAEAAVTSDSLVVTLTLVSGATIELIQDGAPVLDLGWLWLRRTDRGERCLVDAHAARLLDRQVDDLRQRKLFDLGAESGGRGPDLTGIELHDGDHDLVLGGRPLAVHLDGGGRVRLDPGTARRLLDRLDALRMGQFVAGPLAGAVAEPGLVVRVIGVGPGQELVDLGDCPADVAEQPNDRVVSTPIGVGCVNGTLLQEIAGFAGRRAALYDRGLIRNPPGEIAIVAGDDRTVLEARGGGYALLVNGANAITAEPAAVTEWIDTLNRLLATATVVARRDGPVRARLTLAPSGAGDGSAPLAPDRVESIELVDGGRGELRIRRQGESVDWLVDPGAARLLSPAPLRFQARQLIAAEPFGLRRAMRRRGERLLEEVERGELLEEWRVVAPAGQQPDAAAIAALRQAAAGLHALGFAAAQAAPRHRLSPPRLVIEVVFDAPPGGAAASRHRIEIGATTAIGCYVRVDDSASVAEIDRTSCEALSRPWSMAPR